MIKEAIARLVEREDLSEGEASAVMEDIMEGRATQAQIAAFLTALRMKGETVEEFTGLARVMRARATPLNIDTGETVVDTCGTGGDRKDTFNISTATAFVVAGSGLKVAKHGNKASSSLSGSADVLKCLGVNIEANKETVIRCLQEARVGFLFAPLFHPSMRLAQGPRQELGVRTTFNILGPLTNPVKNSRQLIGVHSLHLTRILAMVLRSLGAERAMVVYGLDGLDEITTTERTRVVELKDGKIKSFYIEPEDYGIKRARLEDLVVHSPEESAQAIKDVLAGRTGAKRDIVLLNAAATIMLGGLAKNIKEGLVLAGKSLDSGQARQSMEKLVELSWKACSESA